MHQEIDLCEIVSFYNRKLLSKLDKVIIAVVDTDPRVAISSWTNAIVPKFLRKK